MTYKPVNIVTDDDKRWAEDRDNLGWVLPKPAPAWKRWPVIRKIRAVVMAFAVDRHETMWGEFGGIPSGYDEWVLYAIGRGWC